MLTVEGLRGRVVVGELCRVVVVCYVTKVELKLN